MNKTGRIALWTAAAAAGGCLGWQAVRRADDQRRNGEAARGKHIVIVGAGFGGTNAARELARLLPGPDDGQITLIDQHPYMLFTPMLTEAAGGEIDPRHIVSPVQHLPARVCFVQGRVQKLDLSSKTVTLEVGEPDIPQAVRTIRADQLVLALGSESNFHHIPGVEEHSLTMKKIEDASAVAHRAISLIQRAAAEPDEHLRRALLTFVVGGGGYTGAETMAALNDMVRDTVAQHPRLKAEEIRTIIIEPGPRLLAEITPDLAAYAQRKLEERQVEVLLNTKIAGAGDGYVELEGGRRIETQMLIWTAGVKPNSLLDQLNAAKGKHGGLVVDPCCAVKGQAAVWALGDCAEIPQPDGSPYAPTAQNATREGVQVARNIVAVLRGESPKPFVYVPIGELALVGKRTGVARVYGHNFSGFTAWAMWRAVYLAKMPGLGQRARILTDWLLDFAFGRPDAALPARGADAPAQVPQPAVH